MDNIHSFLDTSITLFKFLLFLLHAAAQTTLEGVLKEQKFKLGNKFESFQFLTLMVSHLKIIASESILFNCSSVSIISLCEENSRNNIAC